MLVQVLYQVQDYKYLINFYVVCFTQSSRRIQHRHNLHLDRWSNWNDGFYGSHCRQIDDRHRRSLPLHPGAGAGEGGGPVAGHLLLHWLLRHDRLPHVPQ